MDYKGIETFIRRRLELFCKPSRIEHSLSTADTASRLCERFAGPEAPRGFIAGLGHDLMKDRPLSEQWDLARRAAALPGLAAVAEAVRRMEGERAFADKIIHGPAAAVFLYLETDLANDTDCLEAVAFHSAAAPIMQPLAKIVFIADKVEPRRSYAVEAQKLLADESLDLDGLLLRALGLSLGWMRARGQSIAQSSLDLYNALTMKEAAR